MNTPNKVLKSCDWISNSEVRPEDQTLPVRQVYTWLFSRDGKVVIVSKDGQKWQFPGGKPDGNETYLQTAVREIAEETGIDTSNLTDDYQFFGYYRIVETDERGNDDECLQLRVRLQLGKNADEYALHQKDEDGAQAREEQVHFAKFVTIDELMEHIPWTRESSELRAATLKQYGDGVMTQKQKHILLLAGANPKNKEWIYSLKDKLSSVCTDKISVFEYSHWDKGGEIDISGETAKLSKYLYEEGAPIILAKSAGSLIALKACQETNLTPEKAIFIGFPIRYAQVNSINYASLLSNFDAPTLYIQAEHDPMGSYQDICEMTKNLPNARTVCIDGDDHNYKDIDELVRLINLFYES